MHTTVASTLVCILARVLLEQRAYHNIIPRVLASSTVHKAARLPSGVWFLKPFSGRVGWVGLEGEGARRFTIVLS